MKKLAIIAALFFAASASASVSIDSVLNGSGTPGNDIPENAVEVSNGIMHAPQYMPGYPTAATLWPRVIEVPCTKNETGDVKCNGYKWSPNLGRGEYLFIAPKVVEEPVLVAPIHDTVIVERSVPVKQKPKKKVKRKVKPLVCTK